MILATNVYRAATQSMTTDEALTFATWVDGPWSDILNDYIPNNHVLHTILAKLSVDTFGVHAWSLRLPSVLGGAFFLLFLHLLTRKWCSRWLAFSAVSFVAFNPFLLDYMSAARGYGLASAALLAALLAATSLVCREEHRRRMWFFMALASGLAVAFILSFVFAVAALSLSVLLSLLGREERNNVETIKQFTLFFALPATVLILCVVIPVRMVSDLGYFSFGAGSMQTMVSSIVNAIFFHDETVFAIDRIRDTLVNKVVPGSFMLFLLIAATNLIRAGTRSNLLSREAALFQISTMALALSLVALFAANWTIELPYPQTRTGIYLVLFFCLALAALVADLGAWKKVIGSVALPLILLPTLVFVAQFPSGHYHDWKFDANSREIFAWLKERRRPASEQPMRVLCIPFQHEPALNFYRRSEGASWLAPVERATEHGVARPDVDNMTFDFLVQHTGWQPRKSTMRRYRVVFRDRETGTVIWAQK